MFLKIKKRVESELRGYIRDVDTLYSLNKISPLLFRAIKDFISGGGKRIRPTLFVVGYLGFAKKAAPGLYRSAISIELMHDFMLIHDDIIDKSATRRGKPSMHAMLNSHLAGARNVKFTGEDLAIVLGDVLYAMSLKSFLTIKEEAQRKEKAFKKLMDAAMYTGCGEFIELLFGLKGIDKISESDIYKIYDFKTANYTFASPLAIGAILGGAGDAEANRLFQYGTYLGRAFQIKDDILGLFSDEKKIGKSNLTDLQEAKLTLLIRYAYRHTGKKGRLEIRNILSKKNVTPADLLKIRTIIRACGALDYAKKEVNHCLQRAQALLQRSTMRLPYKDGLSQYAAEILKL
ncbi:MAG: polyprenyl synthetase family protein [Candidatus Omnitrophota bacterium]